MVVGCMKGAMCARYPGIQARYFRIRRYMQTDTNVDGRGRGLLLPPAAAPTNS